MASTIRQRITPSYLYDGISSASQNLDSSLSQSADESLASLSPSESLTDDAHVGPDSGGRGNDNVQQAESGRGEETEDCEEDPVADDEEQAYNGDEPTPRAAAAAAASSGDGLPDDIRLESDGERPEGDDVDVEGSDEQLDAEKEEQLYGEADGLEADRQAGGCRSPRDGWGTEADDADGASKLPRSSASRSTTPGSIRSQEAGTLRAGSPSDFFPKSAAAAAARRIRRRNSCRDSSSPLGSSGITLREQLLTELHEMEGRIRDGSDKAMREELAQARRTRDEALRSNHLQHQLTRKYIDGQVEAEMKSGKDWMAARRADRKREMQQRIQAQLRQLEREWEAELAGAPSACLPGASFDVFSMAERHSPRCLVEERRSIALEAPWRPHGLQHSGRRKRSHASSGGDGSAVDESCSKRRKRREVLLRPTAPLPCSNAEVIEDLAMMGL